jgi:hypothetical protein
LFKKLEIEERKTIARRGESEEDGNDTELTRGREIAIKWSFPN